MMGSLGGEGGVGGGGWGVWVVFFFQAEDGIRDHCVTGVQTCALPILIRHRFEKNSKRKIFYHPAVWHVFLAQKWPVLTNSL